jgi:hypothetical protein
MTVQLHTQPLSTTTLDPKLTAAIKTKVTQTGGDETCDAQKENHLTNSLM